MKVLVLNSDFSPISVTTPNRGFNLVYKGKAEILEHYKEIPIITENAILKRPSVIRLINYTFIPYKKLNPIKDNVFKRDDYTCLYCGITKNLTIDHVIPRCKGGSDEWDNLATCCSKCNRKKGSRTPEQADMKIKYNPYKPPYDYFIKKMMRINKDWSNYM